ncbi:hypothetical protein [Dorea sp.]
MKKTTKKLLHKVSAFFIMLSCITFLMGVDSYAATSSKSVTLSGVANSVPLTATVNYKVNNSNGKYSLSSITSIKVSNYCGLPSVGSTNTSLCTLNTSTGKLTTAKIRVIVFDVDSTTSSDNNKQTNQVTLNNDDGENASVLSRTLLNEIVTFR